MVMRIVRKKNGDLVYQIGNWVRITSVFFALFLFWGAWLYRNEEWFSWISFPTILGFLLIVTALYVDGWTFSKTRSSVLGKSGFIGVGRGHNFSLEEIESFTISHFSKGSLRNRPEGKRKRFSEYLTFSFITTSGESHDIEIIREAKSAGRAEQAARIIAQYCGKPLEIDRDPDQNLSGNGRQIQ